MLRKSLRLAGTLCLTLAASASWADVSADAVLALGLCDDAAYDDPVSPCYGLRELALAQQAAVGGADPAAVAAAQAAAASDESRCRRGKGVYEVGVGLLSGQIKRYARLCGWNAVWKARRGGRLLDWKVEFPYRVRFGSVVEGLEKILAPYEGTIGADAYVDVQVMVIEAQGDRR